MQAIPSAQLLTAVFLAVLFLQSGLDKVLNRRDNLDWLRQHFSDTPLGGMVPVLLFAITVLELAAGALSLSGAAFVLLWRDAAIALVGAQVSGLCILLLFFGQRVAKDYAGAASLVPYFILCLFAICLLGYAA